MKRKDIPEIAPEEVGISSEDVLGFVKALESSGTQMHGFVILRHGYVVAKGWWQPFAQGIPHSDQSLTKTVTGIAYGIAEREGVLNRCERLIDIFPEYASETRGPYWEKLQVRHILTMSAGMERMPSVKDADWIRKFFGTPIVHEPGTAFFYNSVACSMVGACITKKTGLGLMEYLRPRLFEKLGAQEDQVIWLNHPDGSQNGSGGIVTTTVDNAKFLQLYLQKGNWEGERIFSTDWADFAVRIQNAGGGDRVGRGYGGMMWIRDNCFYADGAMGQLSVAFPENDMVISLHQTVSDPAASQRMMDLLFAFGQKSFADRLPENAQALKRLRHECACLALEAPPVSEVSPMQAKIDGKRYVLQNGVAAFFPEDVGEIFNEQYHDFATAFTFHFPERRLLRLEVESASGTHEVLAGMDGRAYANHVKGKIPMTRAVLSAVWESEDTLALSIRWLENCRTRRLEFTFGDNTVGVRSVQQAVGGFDMEDILASGVCRER